MSVNSLDLSACMPVLSMWRSVCLKDDELSFTKEKAVFRCLGVNGSDSSSDDDTCGSTDESD